MHSATPTAHPGEACVHGEGVELLLFRLGGDRYGKRSELFGIPVANVREIVAMPAVTALAGAAPQVLGLVNLRGHIIQVLDLPAMTGCVPVTGLNIMLITESGGATQALAVEAVEEIVMLPRERLIEGDHGAGAGIVASIACLEADGDGTRLAQVLDIDSLLRPFRD